MSFSTLLREPAVVPLGWTLLHFLWQGALVAMLLAVVNAVLRRTAATARYIAACTALVLMLLSAAGTFVWLLAGEAQSLVSQGVSVAGPSVVPGSVATAVRASGAGIRFEDYFPWLAGIWFAGVLALSVRSAGAWFFAQRLIVRQTSPAEPVWEDRLCRLARKLHVDRTVRLCRSAVAEVPTVIGWLSPVILVPSGAFAGLDTRQLEALLAHELAHIRRHDYLVNLFQTAVETLLFYHPAVWWVGQRIRIERENCCDDMAISVSGDIAAYARALTAIEELRGESPQFAMAADGGLLLARIRRLIGLRPVADHTGRACLASLLAVLATVVVWQAAQSPHAKAAARGGFVLDRAVASLEVPVQAPAPAPQPARNNGGFTAALADAGYPNLTPDQLVAFKLHGVTPDYARELKAAGLTDLNPDELIAFRIHGVEARRIEALRAAGFGKLTPDKLIALQIHGVTPEFARQMKALGIGDPSLDDLVAMRIHGVTPEFANDVKTLGLGKIGFDQLVAFRIHGVDAAKVKELQALGLGNLTSDQVVALRIHNVTPAFVRSLKDAGLASLGVDDAIAASIHGITAQFIQEARKRGLKNPTMDRLLELKLGTTGDDII